jgi:hypothetical protein
VLLAHKYIMTDVEAGALTRLKTSKPPLDMFKMIDVSRKIQSEELYEKAVRGIAANRSSICFEDACKMGIEAFYDIHSLRESGFSIRPGAPMGLTVPMPVNLGQLPTSPFNMPSSGFGYNFIPPRGAM